MIMKNRIRVHLRCGCEFSKADFGVSSFVYKNIIWSISAIGIWNEMHRKLTRLVFFSQSRQ